MSKGMRENRSPGALDRLLKRSKEPVTYDKSFCPSLAQVCKMSTELARAGVLSVRLWAPTLVQASLRVVVHCPTQSLWGSHQ